MMSDLPRLILDCETSASRVKAALDDLVGWLNSIRTDAAQAEADLAAKRRVGDTEIAKLRVQIDERKKELASAEQELRQVRRDLERERKEVSMEKKRLLQSLDEALARC
jgi:chromosome segregation ATPase